MPYTEESRGRSKAGAPSPKRTAAVVAAIVVVAATTRFAFAHVGSLYDDAFIYFRYVRVAREGCFYCFNANGPRVEGVTSPLQFLLLLAASSAGARLFVSATVLGAASVAGACIAACTTALRLSQNATAAIGACAVMAALSLDDMLQLNTVIGLETPLAILVVTLITNSALTEGHPWLASLAVVATLIRPEATLFLVWLPLLPSMRSARRLVPPLIAMVGLCVVRYALFHDVVPNTYHAKAGGTWAHAVLGAEYVANFVRAMPLIALAPAAMLGARTRTGGRYLVVVAACWFAFCLRTGGDHFEYGRLLVPLVPSLVLVGVSGLADRLSQEYPRWTKAGIATALVATIGIAASHRIPEQHGFANVRRWIHVGMALRDHFPGARLAVVPIGAIGYYSRAEVIDLVGLTEPAIARSGNSIPQNLLHREWIGHERHDTAWVLAQRPDVIVTTRYRDRPWTSIDERRPGFFADRLLWSEIRAGRAPYEVRDLEVEPGLHWLLYVRIGRLDRRPAR